MLCSTPMNDERQRDPDAEPAPPSANETGTAAEQRAQRERDIEASKDRERILRDPLLA